MPDEQTEFFVDLRRLVRAIQVHMRMIFLMCLSAVVTAGGVTFLISEKYDATTSVIVRPKDQAAVTHRTKEILGFEVTQNIPFSNVTETFSELVKSRTITSQVVDILHLDRKERQGYDSIWRQWLEDFKTDAKEWLLRQWQRLKYARVIKVPQREAAIHKIEKSLEVQPTKDTFIFSIQATAKNPHQAALIANTTAQIFVEHIQKVTSEAERQSRELLEREYAAAQQQIEQNVDELREFKTTHKVVELTEETRLRLEALDAAQADMRNVDKEIAAVRAELAELNAQLANFEPFNEASTKVAIDPVIDNLRSQLAADEARLAELLIRYTEDHLEVRSLRAHMADIQEKLARYQDTRTSEKITARNTNRDDILGEIARKNAQRQGIIARRENIKTSMLALMSDVHALPEIEARLTQIETPLQIAKENARFLASELEAARIAEAKVINEVRLLSLAAPPSFPTQPIRVYYGLAALMISLLVGMGIAIFLDRFSPVIRAADEAEALLGVPVLGTVYEDRSLSQQNMRRVMQLNSHHKTHLEEREKAANEYP